MRRTRLGGPGLRGLGLALAAGLLLSGLTGCQLVAFVVDAFEKVPAKHKPANRTTVVLVDDPSEELPTARSRGVLAQRIARDLQEQEVIARFVSPGKIDQLRLNAADFESWPIDRIGREVGAKQVLYVMVENFRLVGEGQGHQTYKPLAAVRVKMVESAGGQRLFPTGQEPGHPVVARMPYKQASVDTSANRSMLRQQLIERIADRVSKLFYKHRPGNVGDDLPDS